MVQPLRSLPPQIKKAPLVVPSRRVKFVRVEVIKASLLIRTTTVHYIIGAAWSNVRSLWVISGHCRMSERCPLYPQKRTSELGLVTFGATPLVAWRYNPPRLVAREQLG